MELEKSRHIYIVLYLYKHSRVVTSGELANLTHASPRTIKSDIAIINGILRDKGAFIVSRKSEGYLLEIQNPVLFADYRQYLSVIADCYSGDRDYSSMLRVSALLRQLLSSHEYLCLDDLSEQMYLSRSSLKQDLKAVREYLCSYHLRLESKPNGGLRVLGQERHFRMAMISVFGVNIPTVKAPIQEIQYRKQTTADDYEDIRHTMLDVLRQYHYSIKDIASQGLARYLIVMRNRIRLGYGITLEETLRQQIRCFDLQCRMSQTLFERLQQYDGFSVSSDEKLAVALYLIGYHDYLGEEINAETTHFLYPRIVSLFHESLQFIHQTLGIDDSYELTRRQLVYNVSRIVIRHHFGLLSYNRLHYGTGYEDVRTNPVAISLASFLATYFERRLHCRLTAKDTLYLAHYFDEVLDRISFEYCPQNLVVVSGIGRNYAELLAERIQQRYGKYIRSLKTRELYELRAELKPQPDLVVLDNAEYAYRYTIPSAVVIRRDFLFLEHQLKQGFQLRTVCRKIAKMTKVYRDYEFKDREDCFRILGYKYGSDELSIREMIEHFTRNEERISYARFHLPLLMADVRFTRQECFAIYVLRKPMAWGELYKVDSVMFAAANFPEDGILIKAFACLLTALLKDSHLMKQFAEDAQKEPVILEAITREIAL